MSAPVARTCSGYMALTVPTVPTGMKACVATTPRAVSTRPCRARPSVARISNAKLVTAFPCHARRVWLLLPEEQGSIAIGIEAVAVFDGVPIGGVHGVEPGKGGHQHEQRRTRKVEIGQQQVDDVEPEA